MPYLLVARCGSTPFRPAGQGGGADLGRPLTDGRGRRCDARSTRGPRPSTTAADSAPSASDVDAHLQRGAEAGLRRTTRTTNHVGGPTSEQATGHGARVVTEGPNADFRTTEDKKTAHAKGLWHRTFSALAINPTTQRVVL